MTQEVIGTEWLIQKKRDPNDDAAFNQLIGNMTTMEGIRPFMCPKSNGNPVICMNCKGFRTCSAGQRAVRIADEATKPKFEQKWKEEPKSLPNPPSAAQRTSDERDEFRRACESGNAWHYLMENRGISKDAAGELLSKMVKKYPGLAADFGGSRRIMQRPKVVKITEVTPEKPRVAQEPASAHQEEQMEDVKKQTREEAMNDGRRKGAAVIRERYRAVAKAAFDSGDPVGHLMRTEGIDENNARCRVRKYIERYPDLAGDFKLTGGRRGRKPKAEETQPQQETSETELRADGLDLFKFKDEDEVSLADFLSGFTFDEAEADRREAELQPEEIPVKTETPSVAQEEAWKDDPMLKTMADKLEELTAEKKRLRAEIEKAEERIKCIEDQREALELCINRFRT